MARDMGSVIPVVFSRPTRGLSCGPGIYRSEYAIGLLNWILKAD